MLLKLVIDLTSEAIPRVNADKKVLKVANANFVEHLNLMGNTKIIAKDILRSFVMQKSRSLDSLALKSQKSSLPSEVSRGRHSETDRSQML
ncbi:hypothetical protein VNO77_24499 [Canavalia gladiata]|uniref:Uncharacterized protein n=1 Tax=Canavalia gladiata TaxID=3824 RepID=A0AAN9L9T1_CANGL